MFASSAHCGDNLSPSDDLILSVPQQLEASYRRFSSRPAILTAGGWKSFLELEHAAGHAAAYLTANGARRGDRVLLALRTSAECRVLEYAVLGYGFVRVDISPRLHPKEIARIAVDSGSRLIYCESGAVHSVRAELLSVEYESVVVDIATIDLSESTKVVETTSPIPYANYPADIEPSSPAMLMYTSGSTGSPKGATVTHAGWIAQTARSLGVLPLIDEQDVVLAVAQTPHLGGSIALNCAIAGASTIFLPHFDPKEVIDVIDANGVTILPLASTMLELLTDELVDSGRRLLGLRAVPYGGSGIRERSLEAAARVLPGVLFQYFGLAEALAPLACLTAVDHDAAVAVGVAANAMARKRLRSAGAWLPGINHKIVAGELIVRGEVVTPGYWGGSADGPDVDGWFHTKDLASFDEDGYLYVTDRVDDVIVSGGFKVRPSEVEQAIVSVAGLKDVVVLGTSHPKWGEGVTAVVVLGDSVALRFATSEGRRELLAIIVEACTSKLANYKKPVTVRVVKEIPRNAAGKPDRQKLREEFSEHKTLDHIQIER